MLFGVFNSYYMFVRGLVIDYPSSKALSYFWNFGSMLGILLSLQIVSGLLLVLYYIPSELEAFTSIDYLTRESLYGVFFRAFHLNGASLLFVFLYLHVSRGLYYFSFRLGGVWFSGSLLLLMMMIVAFLGYVLPMGQMSFWGATVITNLVSTVPFIGENLVLWLWGGYSINKASLSLFFLLHFLVPFLVFVLMMFHLLLLHATSSTSLLLFHESFTKVKFFPYFVFKDIVNFVVIIFMFAVLLFTPWVLGDCDNWIDANPMSSPVHIQPEWYFLFAYAILRCVPNKLGGVVALAMSVVILPFLYFNQGYKNKYKLVSKVFMVLFSFSFFLLTWLGSCPVEAPFIVLSQVLSFIYFLSFGLLML